MNRASEALRQIASRNADYLSQNECEDLNTAADAYDKLIDIIGASYQFAGAYDAPENVLDVLADPEAATQEQIDSIKSIPPTEAPENAQ